MPRSPRTTHLRLRLSEVGRCTVQELEDHAQLEYLKFFLRHAGTFDRGSGHLMLRVIEGSSIDSVRLSALVDF